MVLREIRRTTPPQICNFGATNLDRASDAALFLPGVLFPADGHTRARTLGRSRRGCRGLASLLNGFGPLPRVSARAAGEGDHRLTTTQDVLASDETDLVAAKTGGSIGH